MNSSEGRARKVSIYYLFILNLRGEQEGGSNGMRGGGSNERDGEKVGGSA